MSSPSTAHSQSVAERLQIKHLFAPRQTSSNGTDVIQGLTQPQKSLPPRYFYDDRGSQLFEQICELLEYYPTRTEAAILQRCAEEVVRATGMCELVELGSGSATKTRLLLDAYQNLKHPLRYLPIDVSAGILEASAKQLLADYPLLQVQGLVGTYEQALQQLEPASEARMILFLGSTLGNFSQSECERFFAQVSAALSRGDYFLLGVDLQKPKEILEAAYNDSQGVTAAFNLNVLSHLNRRFSGNFDLELFEHRAFYNESASQIEMHLFSRRSHTVFLADLDLTVEFAAGETILTEISRKFDWQQMQGYLQTWGLVPKGNWSDRSYPFGVLLSQMQ